MVKAQDILDSLAVIAPPALAEEWDNPGLLVGTPAQETERILVALDVSEAVIKEAVRVGAHVIVAHHPMIFHAVKKIRTDEPLGRKLEQLMKHDIAVLAAHTNLDSAQGGVNDVLAEAVGLGQIGPFVAPEAAGEGSGTPGLGRIGFLPAPLSLEAFARQVREALPTEHVRYVRGGSHPVQKVALCSGSGAAFIPKAAALGADAYLTGDVRYHDAQTAAELGIHVIDASHFGTEFPVVARLRDRLAAALAERGQRAEALADSQSADIFQLF